jgi:hypothetical protein
MHVDIKQLVADRTKGTLQLVPKLLVVQAEDAAGWKYALCACVAGLQNTDAGTCRLKLDLPGRKFSTTKERFVDAKGASCSHCSVHTD